MKFIELIIVWNISNLFNSVSQSLYQNSIFYQAIIIPAISNRVVCHNFGQPALTSSRYTYILYALCMLRKYQSPFKNWNCCKTIFICKNIYFVCVEVRTGCPKLGHTTLYIWIFGTRPKWSKLEKDVTGSIIELSLPLTKGSRKKVHFFNGRAIKRWGRGAKGCAIKEKRTFLEIFPTAKVPTAIKLEHKALSKAIKKKLRLP